MAVLLDASRTSLEELTIDPTEGFRAFVRPRQEYRNATDVTTYMPNLRAITLGILHESRDESTWPCLDDATAILDMACASSLAFLDIEFGSPFLAQLADNLPNGLDHPSLGPFEQSIARFTARETAVSCFSQYRRKNRESFWNPILAKAFPLLDGQGNLRKSSQ